MRYGIISDVHSNLVALKAVLGELEGRDIDKFVCPGDTVGYGPRPNECVRLVRELEPVSVVGNHDVAALDTAADEWFNAMARAAVVWTRQELSEGNSEYLRGLQPVAVFDDVTLVHGALAPDLWDYISSPWEAQPTFEAMKTQLCFVGHSHFAEWYELRPGAAVPLQVGATSGRTLTFTNGVRYIVNPGSVGQPRDGDPRAACAVYDTDQGTVEVLRVPYDIAECQRDMLEKGLPSPLAQRLGLGV
ncbi:MAG: metallophosphoesterase family protein [Armatimonadota bacterium]